MANMGKYLDRIFKPRLPAVTVFYPLKPISRVIEIERYTIRWQCATDALLDIISSTNDFDIFSDNGDLELYIEYMMRVNDNRQAIVKEESRNRNYRY